MPSFWQTFVLEGQNSSGGFLLIETKLDGTSTGRSTYIGPRGTIYMSGISINPTTRLSFQFAELSTTGKFSFIGRFSRSLTVRRGRSDQDDVLPTSASANVGVIHIVVSRVRRVATSISKPRRFSKTPFQPMGVVHEQSKRAGLHCIMCVQVISNTVKTSLTLGSKTWRAKGRAGFRTNEVEV